MNEFWWYLTRSTGIVATVLSWRISRRPHLASLAVGAVLAAAAVGIGSLS